MHLAKLSAKLLVPLGLGATFVAARDVFQFVPFQHDFTSVRLQRKLIV